MANVVFTPDQRQSFLMSVVFNSRTPSYAVYRSNPKMSLFWVTN